MAQDDQNCIKKLQTMRQAVNWEVEQERGKFLRPLCNLIEDWKGQLPNLKDIFKPEEIDWLLVEYVDNYHWQSVRLGDDIPLIEFVTRTGYKDDPVFDKNGKPSSRRTTAVHQMMRYRHFDVVRDLFKIYDRFDVNYTDELGRTHFHAACKFGLCDIVETFLELGQDPNCLGYVRGDSPLHLALMENRSNVAELLLRNGADPNLANENGVTPLHIICEKKHGNGLAQMFLKISEEKHHLLQVDALDKWGNTSLHLAVSKCVSLCVVYGTCREMVDESKNVIKLLLRKGANPNLADAKGLTALHIISQQRYYNELAEMFFEICDEEHQLVQVDARDKLGNTPLHLALRCGNKGVMEVLLRRGAGLNFFNDEGYTPLHIMCKRYEHDEGLLKLFIKINNEIGQMVQVDAVGNLGRTPLQLAVANFLLNEVDELLDYGADLSNFVFPNESYFAERFQPHDVDYHLRLVSGALAVVERLEKRGYELDQSNALKIMKLFAKNGVFDRTTEHEEHWYKNKEFLIQTDSIMIRRGLSLYDLIQLTPQEMMKRFTYTNYFELVSPKCYWRLPEEPKKACVMHLCEIVCRRFYRRWATDSLLELTRYRLPILCCEMIIEQLMNQDLFRICLAVPGQSPKNNEKKLITAIKCTKRPLRAKKVPKKLHDYVWSRF